MKLNLIFFTLLLITTTLTHTSNNRRVAANGSYRLPPSKNLEKQRPPSPQKPSKSPDTNQENN